MLSFRARNENVGGTRAELPSERVTNVNNVETTRMTFTTGNHTCTTLVTTTGDHHAGARVEFDMFEHLALLDAELDRVTCANDRVGVTKSAAIVRDNVRDALGAQFDLLHLKQLVARLLGRDAVHDKATLDVVEDAEVLARLVNRDDILKPSWEVRVGANLAVNLDQTLVGDRRNLLAVERVL